MNQLPSDRNGYPQAQDQRCPLPQHVAYNDDPENLPLLWLPSFGNWSLKAQALEIARRSVIVVRRTAEQEVNITVQRSTIQNRTVQYTTVQNSTAHYLTLNHITLHRKTVQYGTIQNSTIQNCAVLYGAVWCCAARCDTVPCHSHSHPHYMRHTRTDRRSYTNFGCAHQGDASGHVITAFFKCCRGQYTLLTGPRRSGIRRKTCPHTNCNNEPHLRRLKPAHPNLHADFGV